jgi:Ca2+-transporting ATPase
LTNPTYWLACAAGVVIMLAIVYVPWVQVAFKTGPLGLLDWAYVLLAAVIFVAFRELGRLLRKRRLRAHAHVEGPTASSGVAEDPTDDSHESAPDLRHT